MISKQILRPGMLVELGYDHTICIIGLVNSLNDDLAIYWNDGSYKCLPMSDYNDDLTFHSINSSNNDKYQINKVYGVGGSCKPFGMDTKERFIIWERDKKMFSQIEKTRAIIIRNLFKNLHQDDFLILEHKHHFIEVKSSNGEVFLQFPGYLFPNLKKDSSILLDGLIDFKNE